MIPCIAYAAKSSPDEKESTTTQLEQVRTAIEAAGGRSLAAEFHESNVSGFKSERGPQLEAAMAAAKKAATESGEAELWVWHTSRLSRGDGTKGKRSLLKVYADLLYEGVQLRSVNDDEFVRNAMLVGIASEQNNKYSRDLSAWVKAGKDRQMAAGRWMGGPLPDGLRRVVTVDEGGTTSVHGELDDNRATIILRVFEMAEEGRGDSSIARALNAEGLRTESEGTWTRRRIQDTVTNPAYAGRIVRYRGKPNEEVAEATYLPALIDGDRFDAIQRRRAGRDKSAAGRERARGGRRTLRFALSRLAVCDRCGSGMYCVTSPYERKDGTHARHYVCKQVRDGTGVCDAPKVAADAADAAFLPHLRGCFVDFEAWLDRVASRSNADRNAVASQLADARASLGGLMRAEIGAQTRYATALAEEDNLKAAAIESAMARIAADRKQKEAHTSDLEATVAEMTDADAPTDRMFDFWNDLSAAIRGKLDSAETVADVNEGLREVLHEVRIKTLSDGRIWLQATFDDRDEWQTEEGLLSPSAPPLYPNTVLAEGVPTLPIETGRSSQE